MIDPSTIQIVPLTATHIDPFRSCLDEVAREGWLAFTEAPPPHAVREFILQCIQHDIPQFVALDGPVVAGWCDISPKELPGFQHCGRLGMGLRQPYRRAGIGTRLVRACIEKARGAGLERVELEVFASNDSAIALYRSLGFVEEGRNRRAVKRNGRYDDILWMALLLNGERP